MSALDDRLYGSYLTTHAGYASPAAVRFGYQRGIRPHLPPGGRVLDLGCGQGELVRLLLADGFDAWGVDLSPEQATAARRRLGDRVTLGDFHVELRSRPAGWQAILATDVLEHLDKAEVLASFDEVRDALGPGGVFVGRVPNAVSPVGGNLMFGDLTHQTWFTAGSIAQLAAVTGFAGVTVSGCPPVPHGLRSAARALVWKPISGLFKLALAAETGRLRGHVVTQNLCFVARRGQAPR